jgi:hypothetical protein
MNDKPPTRTECRIMNKHIEAWLQMRQRRPQTPEEWAERGASYIEQQCEIIEAQLAVWEAARL